MLCGPKKGRNSQVKVQTTSTHAIRYINNWKCKKGKLIKTTEYASNCLDVKPATICPTP